MGYSIGPKQGSERRWHTSAFASVGKPRQVTTASEQVDAPDCGGRKRGVLGFGERVSGSGHGHTTISLQLDGRPDSFVEPHGWLQPSFPSPQVVKILFFGCDDYARPSLRALKEGGFSPELVVTKPDAPRGRGRKIYPAEIRLEAEDLGLPFEQPEDPHAPEFLEKLRSLSADVGVVVSYGVIMKPELLGVPTKGHINAHASLLPLYRGAAPIQHSLRDGHEKTGITIIRINEELDAGDILIARETEIGARENAGELRQRLSEMSGKVLVEALQLLKDGKDTYTQQDHDKASRAPQDRETRWRHQLGSARR